MGGDARTVTVQAVGRVSGRPDTAQVNVGVETRAETAQEALDGNAARTQAVLDVVRSRGVGDEDLQTAQLSVGPIYEERGQVVTGYQATNTVVVTIDDVDAVGELVDAVVAAVDEGVVVHGISFTIEDTGDLMATARQRAVDAAREQAGQLADAAGLTLQGIRAVSETGGAPSPRFSAGMEAAADVPVEPGSQELSVSVTVVFDVGG